MSTPAFDPDDPRLTAYALGESGPAEREAVERLLAASPEAREEVEQTVAFVRALEAEYRRENQGYWEGHRTEQPRGKVVEFPVSRRAGWKQTAAFAWKIAAVVAALGVLITLTLRRSSSTQTVTVASSRTNELAPIAPPSGEAAPTASAIVQANVPADADPARPSAAPSEAGAPPAVEPADTLLAMNSDRARRDPDAASRPARQPAEPSALDLQAAKPSAQRASSAPAVAKDAPGASAATPGGGATSPTDRIARSMVQIRTGDGSYVGGVAVTADGWILAARSLPLEGKRPTVILADHREFSPAVVRDGAAPDLCRLRIEGIALPAVVLASTAPADQSPLTILSTDRKTGAARFSQAHATANGMETRIRWENQLPTADGTTFVFNSGGELLAMTTTSPAAKAEVNARSATRRPPHVETIVRPFTESERALLQPPKKQPSR